MSSLPKLPQEVIDQIIDHVALSGDWLGENLLHCVLVNRSVHYRSQQYIFTSIVIRGHARRCVKKIRGLLAIIHCNPHISHYIEELTLEYDDWGNHEDPTFIALMKKISTSDRPLRKLTISAHYRCGLTGNPSFRATSNTSATDGPFLPTIYFPIYNLIVSQPTRERTD